MKKIKFYLLTLLVIAAGLTVYGFQSTSHTQNTRYEEAIERNRYFVQRFIDRTNIPGLSIAISVGDEIVWAEGFGMANLETQTEVSTESKFRIASISKLFTGSVLGKLWDEGKVDLDTSIHTYVDSIPDSWQSITLQNLGEHSSGLSHYLDVEDALDTQYYPTTYSSIKKFKDRPLIHEPGKGKSYSSYAYTVIAAAFERVSEKPYLDFMNDYLFSPLEMTNTVPDLQNKVIEKRTGFYQYGADGEVENAPYINLSGRWAGSGYLSTPTDLVRFGAAHFNRDFVSQKAFDRMMTTRQLEGADIAEGLGWGKRSGFENREMVWGDGSTPGAKGGLLLYTKPQVSIAVLSNMRGAPIARGEIQALAQRFVNIAEGKTIEELGEHHKGTYVLTLNINGQNISSKITITDTGKYLKGSFELTGFQQFEIVDGFKQEDGIWLYAVGTGGGPIPVGLLPIKIKLNDKDVTGDVYRIGGTITGTKI